MNSGVLIHIARFIALILIQILVFDQLDLGMYIVPFVYLLFILRLPIEISTPLLLLLGFTLGLTIDFFHNTWGLHTSACVTVALARGYVLKFIAPRDGYEPNQEPSFQGLGFLWFVTYVACLVFVHHIWLFILEAMDVSLLPHILLKIFISTIISTIFVVIVHLLTSISNR